MADEELDQPSGEESQGEETPQKKGKMKLIIILVAVLVLGAGGFFGWKFFMAGPEEKPAEEAAAKTGAKGKDEKGGEGKEKGKGAEKPGTILNLEPLIVNLADTTGKRYLKVTLTVDTRDDKLKKELEARLPMIKDSLILLLTSKSYADISSVAGKLRLRNEVLKVINNSLGGAGAVHAVYFTEFVVQ